jgi:hypothetical protein
VDITIDLINPRPTNFPPAKTYPGANTTTPAPPILSAPNTTTTSAFTYCIDSVSKCRTWAINADATTKQTIEGFYFDKPRAAAPVAGGLPVGGAALPRHRGSLRRAQQDHDAGQAQEQFRAWFHAGNVLKLHPYSAPG